jgi:hypothetical protein
MLDPVQRKHADERFGSRDFFHADILVELTYFSNTAMQTRSSLGSTGLVR